MLKKIFLLLVWIPLGIPVVFADSTQVRCVRDFSVSEKKILVTLTIHKPEKGGFARIYEKLPAGATVSKVNCGKALHKTEKSMLKIVWEDIPISENIEVTYEIRFSAAIPDTLQSITGSFSAEFLTGIQENLSIETGTITRNKLINIEEPVLVKVEPELEKNTEKEVIKEIQTTPSSNSSNSAEGTYICIQVAAVGYQVKSDYLNKTFGYTGEYDSHFEDNIYRLTVGRYKSQAEADAALQEYKSKYFKKCFLSAYKNGEKIPVYEAVRLLQ